ncbi:MAG: TonB-dependent receptor plug domain-containing protein [Spirochaetota bacterium]|nr:TonB-dependent receptor plug domain-containing protein [Spirochaetota bacterium]
MKIRFYNIILILLLLQITSLALYSQRAIITEEDKSENEQNNTTDEMSPDDIILTPITVREDATTKRKGKDIQSISSHIMTARELKQAPATLGDSLNALATLPGITRSGIDLFGQLIIRGADERFNNYYIDDIPIFNPLHYNSLHSIINTNLIGEIDIYASAFPAEFGSATAAIINITTVDDVQKFEGYGDLSALSANILLQAPISHNENGDLVFNMPWFISAKNNTENAGYVIVSGRFGYPGLVTAIISRINEDIPKMLPIYWDYQAKCKYCINSTNSISLLFIGGGDYMNMKKDKAFNDKEDPLAAIIDIKMNKIYHAQGLYYTYMPSKKFNNKFVTFNSLNSSYIYNDYPLPGVAYWAKDIHITSRPYIVGLKNKTKFEWWNDHSEVRTGLEYRIYYFTAHGKSVIQHGDQNENNSADLGDPDHMLGYQLDERILNYVIGGYLENKLTFEGFTLLPGLRSEYLNRAQIISVDPRIMIGYKFPTGTTLSAAGGKYSYFLQTNPYIFDKNPDIAKIGKKLKPEKAIHRVIGIEQEIGLFTVKVEGFNNYYYDIGKEYPHFEPDGTFLLGLNSAKIRTKGMEIMLRKDRWIKQDGFFGYISYTYTKSKVKSGLPTHPGLYSIELNDRIDEYGDQWINFENEQRHSVKLTGGYVFGQHTISSRFELYSSFPYTPIIGSKFDAEYYNYTDGIRYVPIYGKKNTKHFPMQHRLDLRYSLKRPNPRGYINFYIEILNIYNHKAINIQRWDYRYPYSSRNPSNVGPSDVGPETSMQDIAIMPNFGIEIKF